MSGFSKICWQESEEVGAGYVSSWPEGKLSYLGDEYLLSHSSTNAYDISSSESNCNFGWSSILKHSRFKKIGRGVQCSSRHQILDSFLMVGNSHKTLLYSVFIQSTSRGLRHVTRFMRIHTVANPSCKTAITE